MKRVVRFLWMLPLLVVLAGCFAVPASTQEAAKAVETFLMARAEGDAKTVWSMLSPKAQKAISRDRVADYLAMQSVSWESIGAAEAGDGFMQVPVHNFVVRGETYQQTWPEYRLTLTHDGKRWRVSWVDPLLYRAQSDYQDRNFAEELDLGRTATEIAPTHFGGYLEMFYAYWGLDRYREADWVLLTATQKAQPYQLPEVYDATARFKLGINQPDDAVRFARLVLDGAASYPSLYSKAWQADTLVVLGKAQLVKGNRAEAEAAANQAGEIDPTNGTLAAFRWMLAQPTAPAPATTPPPKP